MGFERMLGTQSLTAKAMLIGERDAEFPMSPARGEQIEREALPKVHHRHDRPAIGFQYLAAPTEKVPADQADDRDERDASNHDVSSTPGHPKSRPACG